MSLFSPDKIIINEASVKSMDIDTLGYADDNVDHYSFVQEGYNAILEMNADHIRAEKVFFESVLGSYGNDSIINESFSDFFDKIKEIITKFIDWLKKIFKEFIIKINALVSSDKYIKKHHKLLYKFETEDEFDFKGYVFTHVEDSSFPKPTAVAVIDDAHSANVLSTDLTGWSEYEGASDDSDKVTTANTLNSNLDTKTKELEDGLNDFYDEFRGIVINKSNEKIDSSEFANELFEVFRNDTDTPETITINASEVSTCYRRFSNHKELIKSIEKNQKAMIKEYEALEKYLDKMITVKKAGDALNFTDSSNSYVKSNINALTGASDSKSLTGKVIRDTSTSDKMNNYVKILSAKTSQMCQIHTQAFSAKLEAAKDMFKQDKAVIYKALQKIVKRTGAKE